MFTSKRVTRWDKPATTFDSVYGRVTFREWCEFETKRFAAAGQSVSIISQGSLIALTR